MKAESGDSFERDPSSLSLLGMTGGREALLGMTGREWRSSG
jgi:hypothetical protein